MAEEKKGFFKRLVSGLAKTRDNIVAGFDSIFSGYSSIDEDFYEELEEILVMGDIGINATSAILENLKKQVAEKHIKNPMECKQLLIDSIKDQMRVDSTEYEFENRKSVILMIGVNGVGKTTSVGKLAGKLKEIDPSVPKEQAAAAIFGGKLKTICSGGAYLDPDCIRLFKEFGITILQGYGMTECSPVISTNLEWENKIGSVGKLLPNCEAKTVDHELWVRGSSVMQGYYKMPEETAETLEDGWLKTGDKGYVET